MSKLIFILVAILSVLACGGCARYVMQSADQGVVAIPMNTNIWPFAYRDEAHKMMIEHFPEGYIVEQEREAVVGQTTQFDEVVDGFGVATTNHDREWQIHYRSKQSSSNDLGPSNK